MAFRFERNRSMPSTANPPPIRVIGRGSGASEMPTLYPAEPSWIETAPFASALGAFV
jgi:hypothetical protein